MKLLACLEYLGIRTSQTAKAFQALSACRATDHSIAGEAGSIAIWHIDQSPVVKYRIRLPELQNMDRPGQTNCPAYQGKGPS